MPLLDSGPRRHAQPGQLGTLILAQRAVAAAAAPLIGVHRLPGCPFVDPQVPW